MKAVRRWFWMILLGFVLFPISSSWAVGHEPPPSTSISISYMGPDNNCTGYRYHVVVTASNMYWSSGFIWGMDFLNVTFANGQLVSSKTEVSPSPVTMSQFQTETRSFILLVQGDATPTVSANVMWLHPLGHFEGPPRAESSSSVRAPRKLYCPAGCPSNGTSIGSSVNFASGNLYHSESLFSTRGAGPQVEFSLHYNSSYTRDQFPLGRGWTHSYNTRVIQISSSERLLIEGSGKKTRFRTQSPGVFVPEEQFGRAGDVLEQFTDGTYRLTDKSGSRSDFKSSGYLTRITDRNGLSLTCGYDTYGDMTSLTDAGGRVTHLAYDQHKLVQVTDPAGNAFSLTYDWTGQLATVEDDTGRTYQFGYNLTDLLLATRTDHSGNVTQYSYDENGWVIGGVDTTEIPIQVHHDPLATRSTVLARNGGITQTVYDPALDVPVMTIAADNAVTIYRYDENRNLLSTTDPAGNTTSHTYDEVGNRLTTTDPLEQTTTYTYNDLGQVTSVTDPEGAFTRTEYDSKGNVISTTDAEGATTTYVNDAQGKMTSMTRPGGGTTTYTYDPNGNLATVTDPANLTTTFRYDALGNMTSRTDANDATTTFVYDNASRLIRTIDPYGRITAYTYDPNGNRTSETDAVGNVTRFEYNEQNRLVKTTDALGNITRYEYSFGDCGSCGGGGDLLASITDARGNTTRYTYDVMGRKKVTTDPMGASTWFEYGEPSGILSDTFDSNGRQTSFIYDSLSRVTAQIDPKDGVTYFDFTPSGQTDNVIDANGNRTHYAYDNVGRVIQADSPDTGTTIYGYNPDGTLATKTDANGTEINYGYDNNARLTHISFPDPAQDIYFSYDSPGSSFGKGRLTGMTDASGSTVYHYDALGRTVREEATILGVPYTTQYAYDNVGNLSSLTYPGGRIVTTAFDPLHRTTQIDTTVAGTATTLAGSFTYDNVSNLTGFTLGNGIAHRYAYDAANRIKGIDAPGVTGLTFSHDPVGQIVSIWDNILAPQIPAPEKTSIYAYQANRLQSVTEDNVMRSYAYDSTGNTISDGVRTFVYNQNQRLIEAWQGWTKQGEYVYDGKGRRVIKHAGGVTTVYHYDQQNRLIAETDGAGNPKVDYVWMGGAPLAQIRTTGPTESAYYYTTDHLGTPKAMTDNTQAVVWRVETDPFGNEIGTNIKMVENNLRFAGQYYDAETGLIYNLFRNYDSRTGRYNESDPIGIKKGDNHLYTYARNNPVLYSDSTGLFSTYDAFKHYFIGRGTEIALSFQEVDIGLQPRDFEGFESKVRSMYKIVGKKPIDLQAKRNIGGWAGVQTYKLQGEVYSDECKWKFYGLIGAFDNPFDFNEYPWGVREYWAEVVTRIIGHVGPHIGGQDYNITFVGYRYVEDGGRW